MQRWLLSLAVLMGLLALASCASEEKATPAPSPTAATRPAWEQEWDRVVEAAKKEGKVTLAAPLGDAVRKALTEPFEKRYGITVEYQGFSGPEFPAKLRSERAAGQYLWDFYIGGSTTAISTLKMDMKSLDAIEPNLILPEVTDPKSWRGGKLGFLDKDKMVYGMTNYTTGTWWINPTLVKLEEFKSWKDLLDPKWKGKILMSDPKVPGAGQSRLLFFYLHPQLGPDFIRALAPQLVLSRDYQQMTDWIATGRYPIHISEHGTIEPEMVKKGAPLASLDPRQLKEGGYLASGVGNLALINRPAHPNAAKVYLNWLLSKEGQTEFSRGTALPSRRLDVPTDHLDPARLPIEGAIDTDVEEAVLLRQTKIADLANELFGR
ncbi:MAG TPA: ABC transporter substrate-binding protein [Dehalococcoidia bacterium]|nr:ABC transporter substrate-binding protein [Dehalococcoidia bacterium]